MLYTHAVVIALFRYDSDHVCFFCCWSVRMNCSNGFPSLDDHELVLSIVSCLIFSLDK